MTVSRQRASHLFSKHSLWHFSIILIIIIIIIMMMMIIIIMIITIIMIISSIIITTTSTWSFFMSAFTTMKRTEQMSNFDPFSSNWLKCKKLQSYNIQWYCNTRLRWNVFLFSSSQSPPFHKKQWNVLKCISSQSQPFQKKQWLLTNSTQRSVTLTHGIAKLIGLLYALIDISSVGNEKCWITFSRFSTASIQDLFAILSDSIKKLWHFYFFLLLF